jgi:hypothetical protein
MKKVCSSDIADSPHGFESDDLRDAQGAGLAAFLRGRTEAFARPQIRAYSTGTPRWVIDISEKYKLERRIVASHSARQTRSERRLGTFRRDAKAMTRHSKRRAKLTASIHSLKDLSLETLFYLMGVNTCAPLHVQLKEAFPEAISVHGMPRYKCSNSGLRRCETLVISTTGIRRAPE